NLVAISAGVDGEVSARAMELIRPTIAANKSSLIFIITSFTESTALRCLACRRVFQVVHIETHQISAGSDTHQAKPIEGGAFFFLVRLQIEPDFLAAERQLHRSIAAIGGWVIKQRPLIRLSGHKHGSG